MKYKNIIKYLKDNIEKGKGIDYKIPKIWTDSLSILEQNSVEGEIKVNPYEYYYNILKNIIAEYDKGLNYNKSVSQIKKESSNKEILRKANIYALHTRATTAWFHGDEKNFEANEYSNLGTFFKTIAILPKLKDMGINTIYMLPIFQNGKKYSKGDVGSPYAVKDYFKLDSNLKEKLLGKEFSVEEEFSALIEICHMMDIRVFLDFIPRSVSRDNDMIMEHPDWFYWIDKKYMDKYSAPIVEGLSHQSVSKKIMSLVYNDQNVIKHIKKFTYDPKTLDSNKWKELKNLYNKNRKMDFLSWIEEEYGITTAPGFSDCINDSQPQWQDVTFLKFYNDIPIESKQFFKDYNKYPPYVLFDIIKCNIFKGEKPNNELWDIIANIGSFYSKNYGIDGTRIDMGHALPKELEDKIIFNARSEDKKFILIAEEFDANNAEKLRRSGYDMMISSYWAVERESNNKKINEYINKGVENALLGIATSELPDTPRIVSQEDGMDKIAYFAVINNFIPNAIPMISTGMEFLEKQPMNLGLGAVDGDDKILSKEDIMYGKLAFFEKYVMHWSIKNNNYIHNIIKESFLIREKYLEYIGDNENYISIDDKKITKYATHILYRMKDKYLYILANGNGVNINVEDEFTKVFGIDKNEFKFNIIYSIKKDDDYIENIGKYNVKIFEIVEK